MANKKRRTKNRKKNVNQGYIFPVPLAAFLAVVMAVSLSYLWLCGRNEDLGSAIKRLENKKSDVSRKIANEEYKWSIMTSPKRLSAALAKHNLDMSWPSEENVVKISNIDVYLNPDHGISKNTYGELKDPTSRDI